MTPDFYLLLKCEFFRVAWHFMKKGAKNALLRVLGVTTLDMCQKKRALLPSCRYEINP